MRQIVPDVYLFEGLRASNVYLLRSGSGLALVDCGLAGDVGRILAQLRQEGFSPSDLRTIILTHGHVDHTGGLPELARLSGAQVVAHRDEVPFIEQKRSMPLASVVRQRLYQLITVLLRLRPGKVDRLVEDREVIDAFGGLLVVHTPGHTPGSISLYQPERRIVFCGDVLSNGSPLNGKAGLQLPPHLVTTDMALARQSASELAALDVEVLCCGHGEPVLDGALSQLRELLQT